MKKTLLSILAGLAVVGSASAVPGPIERMKLCEKNPDKFVWVKQTEACIPINPCLSDIKEIKDAYCLLAQDRPLYSAGEKLDYVIKYFTEHSLRDNVKETRFLDDGRFVAVYTTGGNYFVARVRTSGYRVTHITSETYEYINDAIAAVDLMQWNMSYKANEAKIEVNNASAFCQEIADLASLLADTVITAHTSDASQCVLKW